MSRLSSAFAKGHAALVCFVTGGDPTPEATPAILDALVAGGADVIELGMPFTDPMADGPAIQNANLRALAAGTKTAHIFEIAKGFRARHPDVPLVLMGYANPIERFDQRHGAGAFVRAAAEARVDGLLVVDYPPEECEAFAASLKQAGLDLIFLLAPTSTDARIAQVARIASGFVYYVSLRGVTGAGHLDVSSVARAMPRIRAHVKLPIGVGFGIRDAATARAVADVADAVVIGAKVVQILEAEPRDNVAAAAKAFMAEIRAALDSKKDQ